ncbi:MAG TPA: sigma 54-interacting transcriptional regulator [Kofleriaceae bacterium]|nr:sigma 54-interacting transcriptional regulator [Kofleriaceae bacterium]
MAAHKGGTGTETTVVPKRPRGAPSRLSLRVVADDGLQTHALPERGTVVIGRGPESDLRVDDRSISRRHAAVTVADGVVTIADLGSANGTRLAERALEPDQPARLQPGEVADLGEVMVILQRGFEPAARTAPAPASASASAPEDAGDSEMDRVQRLIRRVARGTISVLIQGETGVGKEVAAERVHQLSPRAGKPFLRLNCGGFTESLLESELFGHEKGAFTGAVAQKLGLLENADGGTVFLDEVGELPAALQVKLLRVLENRQVQRVGALTPRTIDVRFVAATHRDLEAEIARGAFREDLYYRIAGVAVVIPPLRERIAELAPLARRFAGGTPITPAALAALEAYTWPGNIRELRNVIERAVLLAEGAAVEPEHLPIDKMEGRAAARRARPDSAAPAPAAAGTLRDEVDEVERRRILAALEEHAGNQTRAARQLGISRNTLAARLEQFGIPRPRKR